VAGAVPADRAPLPQASNGRPPVGVERMLRIYLLQQWFSLSDPAVEEALYDSPAMRGFVGIDLDRDPVPDETDQAYRGQRAVIRRHAPKARDFINRRYRHRGVVDAAERAKNRSKSKVRARVEHPIGIIKRVFGFAKVRYRGLKKNAHRLIVTCALANLFMVRRQLLRFQGA
jgi:IS5 family transposase